MDMKNNEANTFPAVNSVHWQAPDSNSIPDRLEISAYSLADDGIQPKSIKRLDCDTVEAFESKNGAPILGVQWHPEAYDLHTEKKYYPHQHQHILQYMAKAGDTYLSRLKVVEQISSYSDKAVLKEEKTHEFFEPYSSHIKPPPVHKKILKLILEDRKNHGFNL